MALRIRKGDLVQVVTGADRGKQGRVLAVDRERGKVRVEKVRMQKRHLKPGRKARRTGGIIEQEGYIDVSNVMLVDPDTASPAASASRSRRDERRARLRARAASPCPSRRSAEEQSDGQEGQAREDQARVVGRDRSLLHDRQEQAEHARTSSSSRSTIRSCASTSSTRRRSSSRSDPDLRRPGRSPKPLVRQRAREETTMTWVITRLCRDCVDQSCVEVCPVDCIYELRRATTRTPSRISSTSIPRSASTAACASRSARGRPSSRTSRFRTSSPTTRR